MNSNDLKLLSHKVGVPIQKLSDQTIVTVNNAPHAQMKTSSHKKTVYIVKNLVFKGPYTCDDEKLMNNLRYTYAIQLLEEALKLPELCRGSLKWRYIGHGSNNQYYLVSRNVGTCGNISPKLMTSKLQTNVPVVPRGGFVWRVSDIEQKSGRLSNGIKSALLQHLYFRFLMDIGDSGTQNILIRENYNSTGRLIAGIDLEDRRIIKEKNSKLSHLFNKLYSRHITLYQSEVSKINPLSYGQLNQYAIDSLQAVGSDLERLKENMELWKKLKLV